MKIVTSLLYVLFLFIFPQVLPAQKNAEKPPPDLDGYIAKVLKVFEVPGVSVSIVKDGKVILAKGYGIKKVGEKDPVDKHTLFSIASNSKAFTTTALAILVEDGKIKWDDPVINYLPWFKMADSYVTTHLTIRDLLVHRSGLEGYAGDIMLFPPSTFSRKEIIQKITVLPLKYDFRTTYAYDNVLYVTAGELISVVSGMPWEEFIQTRIFDKIGMGESLSRFSDFKNQSNIATGHKRFGGRVRAIENFPNQMIGDAGNAAGGIVTNARDMAQWLITQLDSGLSANQTTIFSPASTKELWKVVTPIPVGTVDESLKPMQYNFHGYSSGFRISNYQQYKLVSHGGALDGFVSHVVLVPDLGLGISVFTNQESTGAYNAIIYHILDYYMKFPAFDWIAGYKNQLDSSIARKEVQKQLNIIQPVSGTKPSLSIEKYAGVYTDKLIGDLNISLNEGKMVLRFEQSPQLIADMNYFQYNTFVAKFRNHDFKADSYVTFLINASGKVDEVKLSIIDPDSDMDFESLKFKPKK